MSKHRKNPDRPEPEYEVGYQKAPAKHRFKKGHKGFWPRREKRFDLLGMMADALERNVTIPGDGKPRRVTFIEAIVERLIAQVANNPAKYLKPNLPLIQGAVSARDRAAGFDENGVDMTAEFRRRIEKLAERYESEQARHSAIDNGDLSGA